VVILVQLVVDFLVLERVLFTIGVPRVLSLELEQVTAAGTFVLVDIFSASADSLFVRSSGDSPTHEGASTGDAGEEIWRRGESPYIAGASLPRWCSSGAVLTCRLP
jgi:hypothetical protein